MRLFILAAVVAAVRTGTTIAEELRIGTASLGGAFDPMGQLISNLVNKHAGNDISMVSVVTGGSAQNPRLTDSGEVEISITNNNLAKLAVAGAGSYSSVPIDIKAVAALQPQRV
ncbi:TAXI family TRAP transporter solute-binding subunit [Yoonia sediminilitoris]|uniref:NMT1 family protein n=1 Tax=Yoonia sediminilitoris TaxID=1286148 RepID=A0A2T6KG96_9RHOB|nr:TAXI family TRAP transporter solute-binding subunit [Yoonia sediminilitoris]PUB14347.1 NMT1 family protein [Yoonia sediminilitoris]RCW95278.1 NMT1 family protein [Yoonia sediminilitoris]